MNEIIIDTSLMQQMANIALRAATSMEEAMKSAEAVTEHNDWNCVERDFINENILKIKKNNHKINENMALFSSKINELAEKFNDFDHSLMAKFSNFDSSIGNMMRIEDAKKIFRKTGYIPENFNSKYLQVVGGDGSQNWRNFNFSSIDKPISVVDFSDAIMMMSSKEVSVNENIQADIIKNMATAMGIEI